MMTTSRMLVLIALGLGVIVSKTSAQDPYSDYTRDRAYRYFITSPYSFRTYSSLGSGRAWSYETPMESGRFWETPSYFHEEITPFGHWSSGVPSRVEGYIVPRPQVIYPPVYPAPYVP